MPGIGIHRRGDEAVEHSHEHSAGERQQQALRAHAYRGGRLPAIGQRIQDDRECHQRHADPQECGITDRDRHVVQDYAQNQRQPNADRKGHRHAGDLDGGHQQDVGQVEYRAAEERVADAGAVGLQQIGEERRAAAAQGAEGRAQNERDQQHAEGVIPVEELEPPARWRELAGVGPRAPTEHRDDAEDDCQGVAVDDIHCGVPPITLAGGPLLRCLPPRPNVAG